MRIELDKPLTKTKLRQALKMMGSGTKKVKIIMGAEIFDIDTIVSKNDTMFLCTNSKETADFYEKRVIPEPDNEIELIEEDKKDYQDPISAPPRINEYQIGKYDLFTYDDRWEKEWEKYRKKHNLPPWYVGDTPGFGDDVKC